MEKYHPYWDELRNIISLSERYGAAFFLMFLRELWGASYSMEIPWRKIHMAIISPLRVAILVAACKINESNIEVVNSELRRRGFTESEGYDLP
jgi:hypothetical protein